MTSDKTKKPSLVLNILLILLVFSLGVILSSLWWYLKFPKKVTVSKEVCPSSSGFDTSKISINNLPVGVSIFTNPAINDWRGTVNGKIISKNEHTFTLENDQGNKITITDNMKMGGHYNTIFNKLGEKGKVEQVKLKDIPIGTKLLGDIWVFKADKDTPIGGIFSFK